MPALKILEASIGLGLGCLALGPDIGTLVVTFNCDMVVARNIQLLGGQAVVTLPDLQADTIDASVRAKVNTVIGGGQAVGCDTDLGATLIVDELLKGEEGGRGIEAVVAVRRRIVSQLLGEARVGDRVTHIVRATPLARFPCVTVRHFC